MITVGANFLILCHIGKAFSDFVPSCSHFGDYLKIKCTRRANLSNAFAHGVCPPPDVYLQSDVYLRRDIRNPTFVCRPASGRRCPPAPPTAGEGSYRASQSRRRHPRAQVRAIGNPWLRYNIRPQVSFKGTAGSETRTIPRFHASGTRNRPRISGFNKRGQAFQKACPRVTLYIF